MIKETYNKEADAKYMFIKNGEISKTECVNDWLYIDFDKLGNVIGLEILDSSKHPVSVRVNKNGSYEILEMSSGKNFELVKLVPNE